MPDSEQDGSGTHRPRILLVNVFPPGIHVHEIEQGLREVGHDIFTAGLSAPPDPSVPLTKQYPDYRFNLLTTRDTHVNDIVAAAGGADLLLFIEPYIGYVPHAIEECDIPTVFLMGDDPIHADWGQPLYARCDVGLTSMHSQYQRYQNQGLDHMAWWHCWAVPSYISDLGLDRDYDFAFAGNMHPVLQRDRNRVLEQVLHLAREGLNLATPRGVYFDELNNLMNRGKTTYTGSVAGHFPLRVFEAMAAGCVVIAPPPPKDDPIAQAFTPGTHYISASSPDQVRAAIRRLARDEQARQAIASAAQELVRERFEYRHAAERFVADVIPLIGSDFREIRAERLARVGDSEADRRRVRARASLGLGDAAAAAQLLDGMAPSERGPRWFNDRGVVAAQLGQREQGQQLLDDAEALAPTDPLHASNRAILLAHRMLMGELPPSTDVPQAALETLAATDPTEVELEPSDFSYPCEYDRPRMELVRAALELTQGPERSARLLEVLRFRLHSMVAAIHAALGQLEPSLQHLEAAAAIVPDDGYTRLALGDVYQALGRDKDAHRAHKRAAVLEPFHVEAQVRLGHHDIMQRRHAHAVERMDHLLEHAPMPSPVDRSEALAVRGIAASQMGNLDDARTALTESLEVNPHQPMIRDFLDRLEAVLPT